MSSIWSARRTTQSGTRSRHADPGDPLDGVGERLHVLDVDRRDHRDASVEDLEHVFPPLGVPPRAGDVGVGQLVNRAPPRDVVPARRRGPSPPRSTRGTPPAGGARREVADLLNGEGPPVRLDETDRDVRAALEAAPPLVEHGARLPHSGCGSEVDAEAPGRPNPFVFAPRALISTSSGSTRQDPRYTRGSALRRPTESRDTRDAREAGSKGNVQRTFWGSAPCWPPWARCWR